jgi:hypothetical protein
VLGSKDYEPESLEGNSPATVAEREKRHNAIRARREVGQRESKLMDPHRPKAAAREETKLVIVAPGRRVPWETVTIPDEYSLDEMQKHVAAGRLQQLRWWQEFGRNVIVANTRMHARVELHKVRLIHDRADRLEKEAERRGRASELRYERAVAKEAREKARKEKKP